MSIRSALPALAMALGVAVFAVAGMRGEEPPILFEARVEPRPLPAITPAPTPAHAPHAGGGSERVTMRQIIERVLRENIDIQWHQADVKLQDQQVRAAWGDFDPAFFFNSTYQYVRTPQNPTLISSADQAQQVLLQQEALAAATSSANSAPTPVPLPSPGSGSSGNNSSSSIATVTQPFIFQNEDFRNSVGLQGKLPLGTTYKLSVEADHLRDIVLGLNQKFLPSDVFFAGLTLDQPLLQGFGADVNLVSVRISRRNRAVAYNNWRQRVIESVATAMATYIDMDYAQRIMAVRRKSVAADQTLAVANQRRVDVGLMTPTDVRQAEIEVSADQDDLLTAQNALTLRVGELKKLIYHGVDQDDGRAYEAAANADLPVPRLERENLLEDAFRNRVDYATAREQAEIENLRLKYYQNALLPRIDVVATLGVNGLSTNSTANSFNRAINGQAPEWIIGVQGSIPLGNVTARANLASSRRLKEEAIWKLKQVELTITTDIDTAISSIRANQDRVKVASQARAFAEEVVRNQNRRLEQGQASTLDVLDNRRRLYEAQQRELGAVNDLNKSILNLYLATGTILQWQGIEIADDDTDAPRHHSGIHWPGSPGVRKTSAGAR